MVLRQRQRRRMLQMTDNAYHEPFDQPGLDLGKAPSPASEATATLALGLCGSAKLQMDLRIHCGQRKRGLRQEPYHFAPRDIIAQSKAGSVILIGTLSDSGVNLLYCERPIKDGFSSTDHSHYLALGQDNINVGEFYA
jgi:hypothetical protein